MIPATLRALLAGLVDYAGLFPPAALDMPAAMREYHHQRTGADAWMLGAFVLPTARLAEFEAAQATVDVSGGPWRLSALPGSDIGSSLDDVARFNARSPIATIDAVEFKAEEPAAISAALARVPTAITAYVELPLDRDLVPLLAAIEAGGGRAKVRTGGITEAAFPPSHALARFIQACAQAGVPFKATAGLHHPLRGEYRLTYEAEPPHGMMFGFLNVFLAAAFARAGLDARQLALLLEEKDAAAFEFTESVVSWQGITVTRAEISAVRHHAALSFGSCSFQEPLDDLRALGLL